MNDVTASVANDLWEQCHSERSEESMYFARRSRGSVPPRLLLPQRQHSQNRLLLRDKLLHARAGESDHFSELLFVKYLTLRRGLHLDQLVARGHHKIHVHIGTRIFFIGEVEQNFAIHNAYTHGRDVVSEGNCRKCSSLDELLQGESQSDESTGD